MKVRDRIKELRRVKASQLRPNPRNWRTHPEAQRDALRGILAEVGYADALLVRELPDGSYELIDGHLRAETTPDQEVPVLVLDVDESEAAKLLAVVDPLAGMAEIDRHALAALLPQVETDNPALGRMFQQLLAQGGVKREPELSQEPPPEIDVPESYQVVVECGDEARQQALYERLSAEGFKCKLLTL